MSKSFKILNGDLDLQGRSFQTVSGVDKLAQDLRLHILERIGMDSATPTYGSALDGGIINGTIVDSFIGQTTTASRILDIKSEVINVLTRYQSMQLDHIRSDTAQFGKSSLSPDQVLHTIDNIEATASGDTVIVRVTITTLAGASLKITLPAQV